MPRQEQGRLQEDGVSRRVRSQEHPPALLPRGLRVPPEDWPLCHQIHHLSHLRWWFSIFLRETNVIFWSTQVSLVFLSRRIKARGEERARRKLLLLPEGKCPGSMEGEAARGSSPENALPRFIRPKHGLSEVEKQLPCSCPSCSVWGYKAFCDFYLFINFY